jgi:transcriptional regulator with GAF, ATPase, and Fis domain
MPMQRFVSDETVLERLEAFPHELTSRVIGSRKAEDIGQVIADALAQIGATLGSDQVTFEGMPESGVPSGERKVWRRPGLVFSSREPPLTIPVTIAGRRCAVLSVELRQDVRSSWPPAVADRLQEVTSLLLLAAQHGQQKRELERLQSEVAPPVNGCGASDYGSDSTDFEDIIGDSPLLRVAVARVQEVAPTDASVMLFGETGTGKELFARALHNRSARRTRPFVCVNCAALPSTLIETELFGHERGAFTGAVSARQGRFEVAHRGTLFLDEIGDLPGDVQAKLLRILQEGEFERIGSSQSRRVDVRLITATHQDLEASVKEGRFRADLFYRLNVFPIRLPPLRDRTDDIPRLVWYFVNRHQRALDRRFTTIPAAVFVALKQHSWPGNVRELENVIERAMIHSRGTTLQLDEGQVLTSSAQEPGAGTLEAIERRYIEETLHRCRWRINGPGNAAEVLGLHPNTLRFRLKKLGIQRPNAVEASRTFARRSA